MNERLRRGGQGALWGGGIGFAGATVLVGLVWPLAWSGGRAVTFLDLSVGILSACMAAPVGAALGLLAGLLWRGR